MSVELYRESLGKFESRTLNRKTLNRWTGRSATPTSGQRAAGVPRLHSLSLSLYIYIYIHTDISLYLSICLPIYLVSGPQANTPPEFYVVGAANAGKSSLLNRHPYIYIYIYIHINIERERGRDG